MKRRPHWYQTAVFYELYVRAYQDSTGDGNGDLKGVIQRLDYVSDLGVDCIWLMPTFPSPLVDDGYDIADYYGVHPDYGSVDDFKALIDAAHARGLRVIADLVLNHTSDQHPWFQASRKREAPYTDYYVWSDTDQKYEDARIIFSTPNPRTGPGTRCGDSTSGIVFTPSSQTSTLIIRPCRRKCFKSPASGWIWAWMASAPMPCLIFSNVRGPIARICRKRTTFLKKLRAMMDAEYPDAILLCEANQWPEDVRPYFGGDPDDASVPGDEFHIGFHFPVMPRLYMAVKRTTARRWWKS